MHDSAQKLVSFISDLILALALFWAWLEDVQHVIQVLAPIGVPVLLGIRIYTALLDARRSRILLDKAKEEKP